MNALRAQGLNALESVNAVWHHSSNEVGVSSRRRLLERLDIAQGLSELKRYGGRACQRARSNGPSQMARCLNKSPEKSDPTRSFIETIVVQRGVDESVGQTINCRIRLRDRKLLPPAIMSPRGVSSIRNMWASDLFNIQWDLSVLVHQSFWDDIEYYNTPWNTYFVKPRPSLLEI
ncbi:hypothetical protein BDZ89DRAFT_1204044 [Hymenopellis radicata]|nr:hypothetical protein BDZ89DRAFT_1204044 [Hymenopellis radicata]